MFSLKNRTAAVALSAGLALSMAACSSDDSTSGSGSSGGSSSTPSAEPTPAAAIDALDGVATTVTLDAGFVEALGTLMLTPGVVGGAQFDANAGTVAFPISGGNVTYFDPASGVRPFVQGEILHDGSGLSLTGGGTTVELTDFVVDPDEDVLTGTVSANGMVAAESAPLFNLDGSNLEALAISGSTATLQPVTVTLTQAAADLLNMTFGTDALAGGFLIGTASVELEVPAS